MFWRYVCDTLYYPFIQHTLLLKTNSYKGDSPSWMTINVNSELMEKKVDGMVCQTQNKHYKLIKILKNIVNIVSEGIFIVIIYKI